MGLNGRLSVGEDGSWTKKWFNTTNNSIAGMFQNSHRSALAKCKREGCMSGGGQITTSYNRGMGNLMLTEAKPEIVRALGELAMSVSSMGGLPPPVLGLGHLCFCQGGHATDHFDD